MPTPPSCDGAVALTHAKLSPSTRLIVRTASNHAARENLLDVAESIIAADGLRALTIRSLTQSAGVNIASVNYFFGTKDSLLVGLQQRMFEPMTQERLDRFAALGGADRPAVEAIVRALLEPLATMHRRHSSSAVELYRYMLAHPQPSVRAASWDLLEPGMRGFENLLLRALPDQPQDHVIRRAHLVCQIAIPVALNALDVFNLSDGFPDIGDLVAFITAGLQSDTA